ncbi:MAG TPA: hypothetical protein VLD37_01280 [Candidatus Bilamarchaeum sp.]|nr:hypothetical protein [Candidatus Bilamarchaeum sp.]
MRLLLLSILLISAAFAHLGEVAEEHSPLDILLDNPAALTVSLLIFLALSYVFYTMFPLKAPLRRNFLLLTGAVAAVFVIFLILSLTREPTGPVPYHTHADFMVYLNGTAFNFSQARYMSVKDNVVNSRVHLHDMDGGIIHHHARNVTLAEFFGSLNMTFNSTCFVTDAKAAFCNDGKNALRMFVQHYGREWKDEPAMEKYVFEDLDRILITYGDPAAPIADQLSMVGDRACIQSEKCPERGMPSDESTCAGTVCNV